MNNIVRIVNRQDLLLNNMIDVKDLYAQCVIPEFARFKEIILPNKILEEIDVASEKLAKDKLTETQYRKDGASLKTRFKTGFKGEAALELLLGIKIMDLSSGFSTDYDHPDVPNYLLGIKTVRYGNFPVIPKTNKYAQIICIVDPNVDSKVYICGIADVHTLDTYQSDYLIVDPNLRDKGTKTGFYGFKCLKTVKELKDLDVFKK